MSGCHFLRCSSRVSPRLKDLGHIGQGYFGPVPGQWWRLLFLLRFLVPLVASTLPQLSHSQLSSIGGIVMAEIGEVADRGASDGSFGDDMLEEVGSPAG